MLFIDYWLNLIKKVPPLANQTCLLPVILKQAGCYLKVFSKTTSMCDFVVTYWGRADYYLVAQQCWEDKTCDWLSLSRLTPTTLASDVIQELIHRNDVQFKGATTGQDSSKFDPQSGMSQFQNPEVFQVIRYSPTMRAFVLMTWKISSIFSTVFARIVNRIYIVGSCSSHRLLWTLPRSFSGFTFDLGFPLKSQVSPLILFKSRVSLLI